MQEGQVVPVSCVGRERAIALLAFLAWLAPLFLATAWLTIANFLMVERNPSSFPHPRGAARTNLSREWDRVRVRHQP